MSWWYQILLRPSPKLRSILDFQQVRPNLVVKVNLKSHSEAQRIGIKVKAAINDHRQDEVPKSEGLIYRLLDSSLPIKYKSPARLHTETLGAILAGTEATANVLVTATFYLLSNPACCERLKAEVREAWPIQGNLDINDLLQLPYLVSASRTL